LRCVVVGKERLVEPGSRPELLPQLQLDELLAELQARLQVVLATRDRMRALLEAVVAIGSGLDLESTLRRVVDAAVGLVDASYGALGVIGEADQGKRLAEFIPVGLSQDEIALIHHWPEGRGLLGLLIDDSRPLRLSDIATHPGSSGFPAGHPPMRSFLGVPVRVRDEVFGNLYLTNKRGGGEFTEDDEAVLVALGAAAGVAVENARLYEAARRQQRWIQASAEVTTRLLSGSDSGEVLAWITRQARELSGADLAVLALPDEEGRRLTITYAAGDGAAAARGLVLPAGQSLSGRVLVTGEPLTSDDFATDERASQAARGAMSQIGPAVVFPLGAPGKVRGVLTVGRRHGAPPFSPAQADVVGSFAAQAGVALELAGRRDDAELLSLYEDRDRIARDLHDLVIQRLYATGMSLEGTMPMITRPEVASRITHAVDAMDETIKDIRATIFALQARGGPAGPDLRADIFALVEEMTPMLGFDPSLRLGAGLGGEIRPEVAEQALATLREALSNAARHADASQLEVTVNVDDDGILSVQVTDDGIGIPAEGRRSGLRNMAGRAEKLGGELRLGPADPDAPKPGTRLEWRVPRLADPAAGQHRGQDPEVAVPDPRRPHPQRQPAQPLDFGLVRHLGDLPPDDHAPADASGRVGPVHLKADPGTPAGGVELGSRLGAEHHGMPVEDEVDRERHRPAVVDDGHPAEMLVRQQLEALRLGELLPPVRPRGHPGRRSSWVRSGCRWRPVRMTGEIRMKWSRVPGAHELRPIVSSRATSPGSVTSCAWPMAVTLQPVRWARSRESASNATTAPRAAAASLPSRAVLITMSPWSRAKLTTSTAGMARRV
jgi:two-component system, NarL family, sensor histidine kinase DevS